MRTNKQNKILETIEDVKVLGLTSDIDVQRLAKRIISGSFEGLAIVSSVSESLSQDVNFAFRKTEDDVVFYGPNGWISVDPVAGSVNFAYDYSKFGHSFAICTSRYKKFDFIQINRTVESFAA